MPGGFWIQFMSDSEINGPGGAQTGSGNGGWGTVNGVSKNTVFFYKAAHGGRIALATWTFYNLNLGQLTPAQTLPRRSTFLDHALQQRLGAQHYRRHPGRRQSDQSTGAHMQLLASTTTCSTGLTMCIWPLKAKMKTRE